MYKIMLMHPCSSQNNFDNKKNAKYQSRFIKKHPSVLIDSTKMNTLTHLCSVISGVIHKCKGVQVFIYIF